MKAELAHMYVLDVCFSLDGGISEIVKLNSGSLQNFANYVLFAS